MLSKISSYLLDIPIIYNLTQKIFAPGANKRIIHEINSIIKYRCGVCHTTNPTFEDFEDPPLGIIFDTPEDILKNIDKGIQLLKSNFKKK